jgi:YesN/AraC family two-component response regulator
MIYEEVKEPYLLIVDDEPFNLVALEGLLNNQGVKRIDKAPNGREALNLVI